MATHRHVGIARRSCEHDRQNARRSLNPAAWRSTPRFCPADVADPFDTVEWELRTAAIKGENGEVLFEQTNCEVPSFWSQLATNVIVQQVLLRRSRHARARAQRAAARSTASARTIADWGLEDGYFATRRRRRALLSRADLALPASARRVQFARLVQRRPVSPVRRQRRAVQLALGRRNRSRRAAREPVRVSARLGLLHPERATTTWKTSWSSPAARPCSSSSARGTGTDLSTLRSHREKLSGGGKPSRPALVHARLRPDRRRREERRQDPPRRQDAIAQGLASRHHGIHRVQGKEEKKARVLIEKGGYEANFNGEAYSSIMFQNANLSVRVTDDFMQAVEKNEALDDALGHRPEAAGPDATRPATCWTAWPSAPGTAAIPACSTTRRSTAGTPARTAAASTPAIRAASTCSSTTRPATWPAST